MGNFELPPKFEPGQKLDVVATEEFWTAPSIPNPAPSLDMLTEQKSGNSQLDSLMDYKKLKGYPLKRVVQLSVNGEPAGTSLVEVKNDPRKNSNEFGFRDSAEL